MGFAETMQAFSDTVTNVANALKKLTPTPKKDDKKPK